jgi:hypothetical protein
MAKSLTDAERERPSWSDPREPRFAQLRDLERDPEAIRREAARLAPSMADYPASIDNARRLDDLIARGIVNDSQVVVVLADEYGVALDRDQLATARVQLNRGWT